MELLVDHTDHIGGAVAHNVHTIARIGGGAPGLMVATSTFQSDNLLSGFKAVAVVVLLDANNMILAASTPQHGWADATWLGTHVNVMTWTFQFDPQLASQAAGIAVLHFPDENYLVNIVEFFQKWGNLILKIFEVLFGKNGNTSSPQPFDAATQSGGGGGGLGSTDSTSWALLSEPWKSRAAIQAQPVGTATASPNEFQNHEATSITVHAADAATNAAISGIVYIGNEAAGHTDTPFTYTWNERFITRVDPRTHRRTLVPLPLPPMTVRADGYTPIAVPITVAAPDIIDRTPTL
jgi:hypothetical protein